jgi:hypothetical protein
MVEIEITRQALRALLTTLPPDRDVPIERADDGLYRLSFNEDALAEVELQCLRGETLSDTIVRLIKAP